MLIMGSFVPPLYYGFYCSRVLKIVYMSVICSLGIMCIIVSLWSKFNTPKYRVLRAGMIRSFLNYIENHKRARLKTPNSKGIKVQNLQ